MEESRQASGELMGTAYHTGCGVQHSLQFVGQYANEKTYSEDKIELQIN